jgi:hypothetical protein
MSRPHQYSVNVCILFKVVFVEGDLSVGRFGFPDFGGAKPFRSEDRKDVLDATQAVGPWFDAKANFPCGGNELRLHISRHEPTLFDLEVTALECEKSTWLRAQRNARGFLVFFDLSD